jgi:NADPH-dependent 2,4-dienoyl-CoA reductase/sulfur reductase-like enzyme
MAENTKASAIRTTIAIIGNGGAAAEAVLALRANGHGGDIHLFADNGHAPYNPMLGTYVVGGKIPLERAFPFGDNASFYDANLVTAHLGSAVTHLDAESRELATAAGETYRYERCLVASGARPAVPPIPGLREGLATRPAVGGPSAEDPDTDGVMPRRVFTLQTLEDALSLKQAVDRLLARTSGTGAVGTAPRAAVVGASFAGVKIAEVLHGLGFQVVLIEREASILPLAAHPEAARILQAHLLAEGYELRLGAALAAIKLPGTNEGPDDKIRLDFGALPGAADPGGPGGTACDDSAAQDEVDLLVVCTGNRSALSFLTPGQVDVGTGILVDEQMQSNIPTLSAAGDVAQGKNLVSGRHEVIGLWSSARYQGRAAGRSLCGVSPGYPGGIPHNITHVGRMLFASMGCVDDYDEVTAVHEGDSWQVRLSREGRLVGLNLLDCCLSAGVMKQAFAKAAMGETGKTEATWIRFRN